MLRTAVFLLISIPTVLCANIPITDAATTDSLKPPPKLTPQPLNITTLTGNSKKESVIECWSVADLALSSTPGIQGALVASLAKPNALNFFNIPAKFDGGLHNAPVVQWVYFTSGKAVISLPTSRDKATVEGGANGLILAADIAAVSKIGHTTVYPGKDQTVGVTIPIAGNKVPAHKVLHPGACTAKEQDISK
ncbi:MAG: hypothetical protein L6R40_000588 [Gallowayella cf. fulva]|nr:MAG: hypothetical protein L6R40_000588 [Xanthomendoza cf. fulva]